MERPISRRRFIEISAGASVAFLLGCSPEQQMSEFPREPIILHKTGDITPRTELGGQGTGNLYVKPDSTLPDSVTGTCTGGGSNGSEMEQLGNQLFKNDKFSITWGSKPDENTRWLILNDIKGNRALGKLKIHDASQYKGKVASVESGGYIFVKYSDDIVAIDPDKNKLLRVGMDGGYIGENGVTMSGYGNSLVFVSEHLVGGYSLQGTMKDYRQGGFPQYIMKSVDCYEVPPKD